MTRGRVHAEPAAELEFNKPQQPSYGLHHLTNAVLLLGLWALTIVAYDSLPAQIPGHIGLSGVTRWVQRESGMWFLNSADRHIPYTPALRAVGCGRARCVRHQHAFVVVPIPMAMRLHRVIGRRIAE